MRISDWSSDVCSSDLMEAARGTGMTAGQRLVKIELPLAMPVILAGIRLSVVISLATATIGSTVAAKTLGAVTIAGLQSNNMAFEFGRESCREKVCQYVVILWVAV